MNTTQANLAQTLNPDRVHGPSKTWGERCTLHFEFAKVNRAQAMEKYDRLRQRCEKKIKYWQKQISSVERQEQLRKYTQLKARAIVEYEYHAQTY